MNQRETLTPPVPQRQRKLPRFRLVTVKRTLALTPRMLRITLTGDDWEGFQPSGPADSLKVTFPAPGHSAPILPTTAPNGPVYAEGEQVQPRRAYTIRRWDAVARELELDFLLHGHGPGGLWAAQANPGDRLIIGEPRMSYRPDPTASAFILAGDEAALPAIATILEALPTTARATVYAEVESRADELPLPAPERSTVVWLHRTGTGLEPSRLLERTLKALPAPAASMRIWLACEAAAMREIRKHLIHLGVERTSLSTQGYWKYGAGNYSDHDFGLDVEGAASGGAPQRQPVGQ